MSVTDPVFVSARQLPHAVADRRRVATKRAAEHRRLLRGFVDGHLDVQNSTLDRLRTEHAQFVDETDFDPTARTQAAAVWLTAGRCIANGYALLALERAGQADNAVAIMRAEHEAGRLVQAFSDPKAADLIDRYFDAEKRNIGMKALSKLEREGQERLRQEIAQLGVIPPEPTDEVTIDVYHDFSKDAHHMYGSVRKDYDDPLKQFRYGIASDPVRQAGACATGTHVIWDVLTSVGLALMKFRGPAFMTEVDPMVAAIRTVHRDYPIELLPFAASDPDALVTQRVTPADIARGRVRFPITTAVKDLLPAVPAEVKVVLRSSELSARYNPRSGPDHQRSGVLSIPHEVLATRVLPGARFAVEVDALGVIALLWQRRPGCAQARLRTVRTGAYRQYPRWVTSRSAPAR
jgi:hypothetical protein